MKTADQAHTGAAPAVPTGNFGEVSRRGVLGAAIAAAVAGAAVVPVATAAPVAANPDAAFWAALKEYRALVAAFEADPDHSDEALERGTEAIHQAEGRLLAMQPHSVAVVSAKYEIVRENDGEYLVDGKGFAGRDVIAWDLERLAMKELLA